MAKDFAIESIIIIRKKAEQALEKAKEALKYAKEQETNIKRISKLAEIQAKKIQASKKAKDVIQKKINKESKSRALTLAPTSPKMKIIKTPEPRNTSRSFLGINNPQIRRRNDGFFEIRGTAKASPRSLPKPKPINVKYSVKNK